MAFRSPKSAPSRKAPRRASRTTARTHAASPAKTAAPSRNGRRAAGPEFAAQHAEWERRVAAAKERPGLYPYTISGVPIRPLYGPDDVAGLSLTDDLAHPGEYPFTRGIHSTMYRGRMFTMRQFAGFGTARESNQRYHYLLDRGQTGLSIAFDNPTIMGYDSDHPKAHGEVGKCGVAIDSLRDMEVLLDGIDPGVVSTSMTINGPASIMFGFYLANAEKRGASFGSLRGTLQNDILKEYIAQKCWCFPPRPSLRIIVDLIEFATRRVPQWNTISVSGYHIREAGSTAAQELAFTLADGFTYVEECVRRGMDVDEFAPRLSFFWNSHLDFFEEIAKLRAARRIWARHMRERYKAKRKESWLMRFHTQTAGCSLWDKQPENNIVRTAFEALAAVLGGTQSLHTNSMDETIALPSDKAVKIALRTQQVIAHELGVTETIDPLGGSYYVESLTNTLEEQAEDYFRRIQSMGGVVAGIEQGFFQREIGRAAYQYQQEMEKKQRVIVGVNEYVEPDEKLEIPILYIGEEVEEEQKRVIAEVKRTRDDRVCTAALKALTAAAASTPGDQNVMERILDCARAYATEGEIRGAMREVYGDYVEGTEF
ncbi:MAG TPA: methylmalonyl-CoA mutase family protein [Candidatus Saccharimonadaceae bacterium]|jgi:methylmalonyl-CoA mutase N-terminal domain/subunit|nr:methylmalonyl-CoA mutase family protein [Candidatus Saccharimonadaceae bacterium]